ncbi:palmitoyltransferase ZDHHC18-B isoform X2 [Alosa sapidissima]|uniref:palmitoyltransferase ZDHHC18-B isoform X2 n=1 Tax=Alosa sapidissima TaxID=34773 RepID=UPI001C080D36|nr:palmitoyltransferase ZDHHC18-B isoform X2 [Alosa sapidissima]
MGRGKDVQPSSDKDNGGALARGHSTMKNCEYQQIDPQALPTPTPTPTPPSQPCPEKTKKQQRKWEVFPGKNRFYCDGRIIVSRQSGVLPLTLGLILVTSGLFFIFDCPFLVKHLTSGIPVIGGVLFVFVVISLLQTSFTDPGILPRATPEEAADIEKQIDNPGASSSSTYRPPPRTKEIVINQQVVKLKYCFTCKIFRPPRTSHCSLCDNCVGSRGSNGLVNALQESPASALELVVCFFSVWSILGLSGFHTYLVASNLTTNEDIKGSWSGKSGSEDTGNPYSYHNIFKNCCVVLCGPMPPSLIDRRGYVPEDSLPSATVEIQLPAAKNDINVTAETSKVLLELASRSPLPSSSTSSSPLPQGKAKGSLKNPSKDAPLKHPGKNAPLKRSGKDAPLKHPGKDAPLKHPGKDAPLKHPGKDAPLKHPGKDAPLKHPGKDAPLKAPSKDAPRPRTSSAPAPLAAPVPVSVPGPASKLPPAPGLPVDPAQGSTSAGGGGGSSSVLNVSSPADKRRPRHGSSKRATSSHSHKHVHTHKPANGTASSPAPSPVPALAPDLSTLQQVAAPFLSSSSSSTPVGLKRSSSSSGSHRRERRDPKLTSQH